MPITVYRTREQLRALPAGKLIGVVRHHPQGATVVLDEPATGGSSRLPVASPAVQAARLAICRACPHLEAGDRCGVLVRLGKGADLMGGQGIPNPRARCPDEPPRWGPAILHKGV